MLAQHRPLAGWLHQAPAAQRRFGAKRLPRAVTGQCQRQAYIRARLAGDSAALLGNGWLQLRPGAEAEDRAFGGRKTEEIAQKPDR